jgi:hypothetical protein
MYFQFNITSKHNGKLILYIFPVMKINTIELFYVNRKDRLFINILFARLIRNPLYINLNIFAFLFIIDLLGSLLQLL